MVIQERKSCQDVAVFSTTASDPDGVSCPPLVAVEGRVTSVADCMPDASRVDSSYFRLKERALTRPKRDARKTIQVRTVEVQNVNHEHEIGQASSGQKCCLTDLHPLFLAADGCPAADLQDADLRPRRRGRATVRAARGQEVEGGLGRSARQALRALRETPVLQVGQTKLCFDRFGNQ